MFFSEPSLLTHEKERLCLKRKINPGLKGRDLLVLCNQEIGEILSGWRSLSVGLVGLNVDELATFLASGENYHTVDEGEESVVLTHTDIEAGVMLSAALTFDDVAGFAVRPAIDFDAQTFAF